MIINFLLEKVNQVQDHKSRTLKLTFNINIIIILLLLVIIIENFKNLIKNDHYQNKK